MVRPRTRGYFRKQNTDERQRWREREERWEAAKKRWMLSAGEEDARPPPAGRERTSTCVCRMDGAVSLEVTHIFTRACGLLHQDSYLKISQQLDSSFPGCMRHDSDKQCWPYRALTHTYSHTHIACPRELALHCQLLTEWLYSALSGARQKRASRGTVLLSLAFISTLLNESNSTSVSVSVCGCSSVSLQPLPHMNTKCAYRVKCQPVCSVWMCNVSSPLPATES